MKLASFAAAAAWLERAVQAAPVLAPPAPLGPDVQPFVHIPARADRDPAPADHRRHRRCPDREDTTLLIDGAKIGAILPAGSAIPAGYRVLDGTGETALPGLVGMHNHMYYIARPNLDARVTRTVRFCFRR